MINEEDKKDFVIEVAKAVLKIEKDSLNDLNRPNQAKLVDDITAKFEEVYSKYENK